MKKQMVNSIALLAMALAAAPAMAGHGGKGRFMQYFDTNADGVVTMAEFKAAASERFKRKILAGRPGLPSSDSDTSTNRLATISLITRERLLSLRTAFGVSLSTSHTLRVSGRSILPPLKNK